MMSTNTSAGRQVRLQHLYRHNDDRLLVVPLDHSVTDGPIVRHDALDGLVGQLATGGADAVVLHKGSVRRVDPRRFSDIALIVHLSASTAQAADPDAKYLVASVEEALRLGADAVSVHVNLGSRDERQQVADLGSVADACDRWNVPLLAMMYPRGPQVRDARDPELVAHAAILAADLGADIVKTVHVGSAAAMADLTAACPVPVIVAGGPPRRLSETLSYVAEALEGGAAGVAMGRGIFQSADPTATTRSVSDLIHARITGAPSLVLGREPVAAAR
ncbi:2-amino-3,7-dideoxy-D-threo-hept-6-ulosonate synthase [Dactylosporangium sp. NPDC049525]|uniref:2-amino-3,7-dideoxy-D-threo-hept-6-ulosonate synthase n=1 Tax=Dactylosporangium sp. NPDC049525 TaxID=3154730 RepID=UPI00344453CB